MAQDQYVPRATDVGRQPVGESHLQGEVRRAREAALRGGPRQSAARWNRAVQATERPPEQREQQSRVDWLTE